jgi:putative flippase GtrA
LRSPESGVRGQGLRFLIAGGTVALVYVITTTILATVVGLPFQVALAIGMGVGLALHFMLQRVFVWLHRDEFALPLHHQLGRYLLAAAIQYGVTAASTSLLPGALGLSTEIVYLGTVAVVTSTNFMLFRYGIFHARTQDADGGRAPTLQA